jgi:hypothetical protein
VSSLSFCFLANNNSTFLPLLSPVSCLHVRSFLSLDTGFIIIIAFIDLIRPYMSVMREYLEGL